MQMRYTTYYIMIVLAGLLMSCNASEDAHGNQSQTLGLMVDNVNGTETRAVDGIQDGAFETNENVKIWVWDAGVSKESTAAYSYTSESQSDIQSRVMNVDVSRTLVPKRPTEGAFRFPRSGSNENKVNIRACYPVQEQYTSATDIDMTTLRTTPGTFTIQTDQSTNEGYKASDLMYGLPTLGNPVANTNSLVGMTFSHKMAKVVINITAGQGITDLTGIDVKLSCVLNAAVTTDANYDMVVEATTGEAIQTGTVTVNNAEQVNGQTSVTMSAVLPPQLLVHDNTFITITRGDVTYVYKPTTDITFLSCSLNTFYITMEEYRLIISGTITPWYNGEGDEFLLTGTIYEVTAREENE